MQSFLPLMALTGLSSHMPSIRISTRVSFCRGSTAGTSQSQGCAILDTLDNLVRCSMLPTIDLKAPPRDDPPFEEASHLVDTNLGLRGGVGQNEASGHP